MTQYTLADLNEILNKVDDETLDEFGRQLNKQIELSEASPIYKLELFITHRCNLRCDYCFLDGGLVHRGDMPIEVAEKAIRFCVERSSKTDIPLNLVLFGGEPLLRIDLMEDILEVADRISEESGKAIQISCTTNSLLLDERAVELSKKYHFNYLISIDGDKENHDLHRKTASGEATYDNVLEKIRWLKPHQEWLGARMTIAPNSIWHLAESVKELFQLGVNQYLIDVLFVDSWQPDQLAQVKEQFYQLLEFYLSARMQGLPLVITYGEFDNLLPSKNRWGCSAGTGGIAVTASGDVFGCSRAIRQEHLHMGNIMEDKLNWDINKFFCNQHTEARWKCMHCDSHIIDYCAGGCPLGNYESMKTPYYQPDICCTIIRALYELREENPRFAPFFSGKKAEGDKSTERSGFQLLNTGG